MALKVLKICASPWKNQSRDKRELSVYQELGADVSVMVKGENSDRGRREIADGFPVYRLSTRPLGEHVPNVLNRLLSLFTWAHFARSLKPDIISAHDMIPALTIGWMASLFCKNKPKLIYDSHEFELGRNAERGRLTWTLIRIWECFLMKRCAFSIMVNDTIADEVQKAHQLKDRPIVLRSTPTLWTIDDTVCAQNRKELLAQTELGDNAFLLAYHGLVTAERGIEELIAETEKNPFVCAMILGNGEESYLDGLKALVKEKGLEGRVIFHEAVPLEELWKLVGAADLSLMMIEGRAKSYYYSLPNKFFESIQSLTPIVSSNFPEMKRIIDKYEIGLTCDPADPEAIHACVEKMRTDRALYQRCRDNLKNAKQELCWEKEKNVLIKAYKEIV